MKKLALLLGVLLISTPLMAQEFAVNIARPAITKKQVVGMTVDNINKRAVVKIQILDADGNEVETQEVQFVNIPEELGKVVKLDVNGDPVYILDENGESTGSFEYVEGVIAEAKPEYNQFMNAISINQTGLNNAVKIKLGIK